MKTQHFTEIRFTKDFATKKAGDIIQVDGMQARSLINRGVAVLYIKEQTKVIHTKKSKKNEKDN